MNIRDIGASFAFPSAGAIVPRSAAIRPGPGSASSGNGQVGAPGRAALLTGEEKQFFESVFPEAKRDIRAFQAVYRTRHAAGGSRPGSHVDRKA